MTRQIADDIVDRKPNVVQEQVAAVRHLIRAVGRGDKLMQLICSDPGIGKSYIVKQELRRVGTKVENVAPANESAFVKALYDHKDDPVLVLDDFDALANAVGVASIFKMAFGPDRVVVHHTVEARKNEQADDDRHNPNIPPQRFKIGCGLIWLSNINFTDPANVKNHMAPHFRAMCSRGLDPFWIDTSDQDDLFRYCIWLGTEGNMFSRMRKPIAEAAVEWFIVNRNRLIEISPRTLMRAAEYFQQRLGGAEPYMLGRLLSVKQERNLPGMAIPKIIGRGRWTA
jgi:hypothetical protein